MKPNHLHWNFAFTALLILLFFTACNQQKQSQQPGLNKSKDYPVAFIKESFLTARDEADNVDSPAIWNFSDTVNWIISTAKETDALLIHDAATGAFIKRVGKSGKELGQLERPNGVAVIDSFAVVVERDNHRVQVFGLPDCKPIGIIGQNALVRPYGLSVVKYDDHQHDLYVSDNYETATEETPADSALGERVHHYRFSINQNAVSSELIRKFGDTAGNGVLKTVESLIVDPIYKTIMISDEHHSQKNIKVYNRDGSFTGKILGKGLFKNEPEGIALYEASDSTGYWIFTDQGHETNIFHVFDRASLKHIGAFSGEKTRNTDGITLTQYGFGNFQKGAFYPVHNDGNIAAISWQAIADSLNLSLLNVLKYSSEEN